MEDIQGNINRAEAIRDIALADRKPMINEADEAKLRDQLQTCLDSLRLKTGHCKHQGSCAFNVAHGAVITLRNIFGLKYGSQKAIFILGMLAKRKIDGPNLMHSLFSW